MVEIALLSPWIFFLFMAIFDFGFYAYALISVENAARVAAIYTSSSPTAAGDSTGACVQALEELRMLPNVSTNVMACTAAPVRVTATALAGPLCPEIVPTALCTRVAVTYTGVQLFPLPGLTGQMTVTRVVEARVKPA